MLPFLLLHRPPRINDPFMLFFATREAVVRAFVVTLELPKEVVGKVSAASGSTSA